MVDLGETAAIPNYENGLTTILPNPNFGIYTIYGTITSPNLDFNSNLLNAIQGQINNGINIGPTQTTYYLMRWADPDCGSPTYRTWVVENDPDPAGLEYAGPKCGATPISGAIISATWIE